MPILAVEQGNKSSVVQDGLHTGVIGEVKVDERQFEGKMIKYLDLTLLVNGELDNGMPAMVRAGYPLTDKGGVSENSMLGKLLMRFGIPVQTGASVNTDLLKNRMCQFQTTMQESKKGTKFSEVIRDTVKPYVAQTVKM